MVKSFHPSDTRLLVRKYMGAHLALPIFFIYMDIFIHRRPHLRLSLYYPSKGIFKLIDQKQFSKTMI